MLTKAATISSKSNGTFGSVLQTLPGMSTASYVLHDDTLQGLYSHGDVHIRNDESEDEFSDSGDNNTDDHEEEASALIRIINGGAISIENEDRSFENSRVDDSQDVEVPFSLEDESDLDHEGCPSYDTKKSRNIFKQNIKNVLEGKEVKFPINFDTENDPRDSRSEDARATLDAMRNHREKGINFTPNDECLLDLYELLQNTNAPMGLFNKLIDWTENHRETIHDGNLMKRKAAMRI